MITALPRFYGIRTSNRRRVQRHYRFFGSRGILALLVVNRETEKSYRPTSTFSTSLLSLPPSGFPRFHCVPTADLAPLSRHKSGLENCRKNKARYGDQPSPRRRYIADNCDRSSNKTNWFIAFSLRSLARLVHAALDDLARRASVHLRRN